MDEVDIEDVEDLSELEARLYAQIHHEPSNDTGFSTDFKEALPVRQVTATSVVNNKSLDKTRVGRYWNDKKSVYIPPTKPTQINLDQSVQEHNVSSSLSGGVREPPAETVDKSFQPSVKNLSNLRVNPFASGNGPNKKGSSSNDLAKNAPATKTKITDQKEKGPFARQIKKLATAVKYDKKRQKAEISKRKPKSDSKVHTIEPTEAIELLSSQDSDQDDVIEVPLSPQKILTIESSSEDESCENKTDFVKPKTTTVKENPSRCTSPCSVISDDFISQSDRMRHLKECDGPDDEDLLMLQEDVDSLLENPQKNSNEASTSGLHLSETPDYRVTQSSFRAFDVYESESDIQDSVYSKGSKPSVVVRIDHESSSGDDVEEINITQKTKRLRKRATSSNKESDTYIDSTDSEEENQNDELSKSRDGVVRTNISFIAHGEALEKCLTDEQSVGRNNAKNSSDKEFLSTLKALAQGTPLATSRASKPESEEEDEVITARAIAENVLQKENASKQSSDAVTGNKQDRNDAVPTETFQELTDAFGKIDDLDKNAVVVDDDSDDNSDKSVELVAPLPVVPQSPLYRKRIETHTGDPIYHIVYSEGNSWTGGIGWNDEMRKFYNNSWKGERFTVNSVCSQMKSARSLWKIYTDDRFPKFHRNPNQKCVNCLEFGHFRSKCPKPKRPLICYMCGERGHHEPRCPNTVCLRCGNKTRMFTRSCNACNYQNRLICPICKVRGHNLNLCPDKWRRYHSTTKPNEYPNSNVEYKNRKFCCICGCRGHLAEHCRNGLRYSEYPIFISEIRSHQKSYDDIAIKSLRSGIGYNLMYKPEEDYAFSLAENKTKQHYYGRFLIAVGMGYMLRRKRKRDESQDSGPSEKQPKPVTGHFKEYIVNPFASAALGMAPREKPTTSDKSITVVDNSVDDPVIEVPSKSGPGESMTCTQVDLSTDQCDVYKQQPGDNPNASNSEYQPSTGTFKRPDASPTRTTGPSRKESDLEIIDSDSNYSFSDHFETIIQQKPREMAPLPDFIPITDDGDIYPDETVGISNAFVSADTDDEETNRTLNDIPCEAKIYLTNFHSKFLLRPEGNKFLVERSKVYDIKARLDWTSVGDILILFGLRENQDKFHMELLHRFRELSDNLNRKHLENSQKVPKKTEVLIRFLRENLAQLQTDLGNVYELSTRLPQYEQQNTKNGWKAAEKTRRTLNMILIGQTGLRNGATHLDNLLSHLRKLIDECKDDVVPNDVRDDIEHNWKVIFSSYRHKNYDQLVKLYQRAPVKNRLHTLNIDPRLLGKGLLDTTLTKAQKDKMNKCTDELKDQPTTTEKQSGSPRMICNPAAVKFQARQAKTPTSEKKRLKQSTNLTNQQQQVQALNSPVANKINAVNAEWENKCVNLLTEIDSIAKVKSGPVNDSKASSMFWSREAMPYIDQCLQLGKSNSGLMEKLSRVSIKSSKGLLSYNDYRAIIKIHTAIKGKK